MDELIYFVAIGNYVLLTVTAATNVIKGAFELYRLWTELKEPQGRGKHKREGR
jgi:hypothetical protein